MDICGVSAILLAGGHSSRMGSNKALLRLNGKTLLQIQLEKLQNIGITDVLVAGRANRSLFCTAGVRHVRDVFPDRGPLGGIHAGLLHIRHSAALVLPVDMPLLPENILRVLIETHCTGITALMNEGQPEPLVAVYDRTLAPLCAAVLAEGRYGPRRLFEITAFCPAYCPADPSCLMNCNTQEEFDALQQIYKMKA